MQPDIQNENKYNQYEIAQQFCQLYYQNVVSFGHNNVLYLFDKDVICVYNEREYVGFYNVLVAMVSEGIYKITYENLNYSILLINNTQINILVTGSISRTSLWSTYLSPLSFLMFIEQFVLTLKDNKICVTSYLFKIIK
jgi:hypothetical protein